MVVSALLNLFVGMPVTLLVVLPNNFAQIVEMLTVMDTFEKWNATAGQPGSMPFKHCFFNLTNGHALLTATLTPVPAFEEVCVQLKIEAQSFDFELSDDESEYTSKTWSRMGVVNPYDWNLEFVTLNPNLLALLASVGGETGSDSFCHVCELLRCMIRLGDVSHDGGLSAGLVCGGMSGWENARVVGGRAVVLLRRKNRERGRGACVMA